MTYNMRMIPVPLIDAAACSKENYPSEKDQRENDLHNRVCKRSISLADAQRCIDVNWIKCREKYVVPEYGPQLQNETQPRHPATAQQ